KDLSNLEDVLGEDSNSEIDEFPYKPLISQEKILNVPWDKENIRPLDQKLKQEYIKELDLIKNLLLNKKDFQKGLSNEKLDNVIKAENKLKGIIILGHFYTNLEKLEKQYNDQEKFKTILTTLKNREFIQKNVDWSFIFDNIDIPFEKEIVERRVELIKSYKANSNNISSIVSQMIQTRNKLEKDFSTYIEVNPEFDKECPLCGDSKESLAVLISQINEKTDSLRASLDVSAKTFHNELESLYSNHISIIIERIEKWLLDSELEKDFIFQLIEYKNTFTDMDKVTQWYRDIQINIDMYINHEMNIVVQLNEYKNTYPDMEKVKKWFRELQINIDIYINHEMNIVTDLDERVQALQQEIINKKLEVNEFCRENMEHLKRVFNERLN